MIALHSQHIERNILLARHSVRLAVMLYTPFYIQLSEPARLYYSWLCKMHGRQLVHNRHGYKIK